MFGQIVVKVAVKENVNQAEQFCYFGHKLDQEAFSKPIVFVLRKLKNHFIGNRVSRNRVMGKKCLKYIP